MLLVAHQVTDQQVQNIAVQGYGYLHSSPELQMKRLLAAGIGDCYSLGQVFRDQEFGHKHNPEFSMLEWYRLGFDHMQLAMEVVDLIEFCAQHPVSVQHYDYGQLFADYFGLCPHLATDQELQDLALSERAPAGLDRSGCLDYLMSHRIEPSLPAEQLSLIVHYPECQAALAKVTELTSWQEREQNPNKKSIRVAERFELYWRGMELANGYHELTDVQEQRLRMQQEAKQGITPDPLFMAALESGLPACAGVALGVDRLQMAISQVKSLDQVVSFRLPES